MIWKLGAGCAAGLCLGYGIAQAQTQAAENITCIDLEQPVYQQLYQKKADGFNLPYCRATDMTVFEQFSQWRDVFGVPDEMVSMIYEYSTIVGSKAALNLIYETTSVYDDGVTTQVIGAIREMGYPKFFDAYRNNAFMKFDALVQNFPSQSMFLEQWKNQLNQYALATENTPTN